MMRLTKIAVAEIQLRSAVRLFFGEEHPVVVETLVGAASGVLRGLAKHCGLQSALHDTDLIKPEYRREWIKILHEYQNFFKHADEDPTATINYEPRALHYLLLEACHLYRHLASDVHLKHRQLKEALAFEVWFAMKYPHLLIDPRALEKLGDMVGFQLERFDPDDFEIMRTALGIKRRREAP
jgi:hypothetical protein